MGIVASPVPVMPNYVKAPRFVMYTEFLPDDNHRVVVVELVPGAHIPGFSTYHVARSSILDHVVQQVLLRTEFREGDDTIDAYVRAERVVKALNNMDLALQAVSLEPDGIQNLFNQLWSSDQL